MNTSRDLAIREDISLETGREALSHSVLRLIVHQGRATPELYASLVVAATIIRQSKAHLMVGFAVYSLFYA